MARDSDLRVAAVVDRRTPPRNRKRWYRCRCGRWWGINKKCFCTCGAYPRSAKASATAQATWDREWARRLTSLGWKIRVSAKGIERIGMKEWP